MVGDEERDEEHRARVRANADYHVEQQRLRRERESARATALLADFVAEAGRVGIPTTELTAQPSTGRGRYRTGVSGWFVRRDRTLGVGTDGRWYVLVVPASLADRVRGHRLEAQPPPLQVGEGARDGESVAMAKLLQLRLEAGIDHP